MSQPSACRRIVRPNFPHIIKQLGQSGIILFIIFVFISINERAFAQSDITPPFYTQVNIGSIHEKINTRSVAWGDVDNDGDLDLAVGNVGVDKLYRNQGGTLQLDTTWQPEADNTRSVAWGDVDNDGDLDLAIGNVGVDKLYRNQGGTLQLDTTWQPEADNTRSIAWGDVDNDGDLDLAVGNDGVDKLYRNQGGTLQLDTTWQPEADDTRSVAWGDVDNDGDLDLAVGNSKIFSQGTSVNKLYRNQGGMLQLDTTWQPKADDTTSVAWGDVDNDGDLDLAVGNSLFDSKVYRNQGGTLQLGDTIILQSHPYYNYTTSVAWGDVDNDGDLDLAVGIGSVSEEPLGVSKLYRNQGGILQLDTTWQPERDDTTSVAWGDVDNDGDLDLAVSNDGVSKLYRNQGGTLQLDTTWQPEQDNTMSVAWGDVDNDGDLDLAVGNSKIFSQGTGVNKLYRNQGGTLQLDTTWQPEADDTMSVAWGDVDNDGDLDLAVGNIGVSKLYRNQGGTLQLDTTWQPEADDTRSVAWGDVDNDGDLDLAVGNSSLLDYGTGVDKLYRNQGGILQLDTTWQPEADDTTSVAWGDVDNDGDLDLAVGNGIFDSSKLYRNQGGILQLDTTWQPERDSTTSVAWGDVDNDDDLDLAVGIGYPLGVVSGEGDFRGSNKLYRNQGGTLQLDTTWQPERDDTTSVAWGDVDNDGDLDLAVGNDGVNKLYRNQGGTLQLDTTWQLEQDYTMSVAWGDVDNDGDLDLSVGNVGVDKLYRNHYWRNQKRVNLTIQLQPASPKASHLLFPYTVKSRTGLPLRQLKVDYTVAGYTDWQPALPTTNTVTTLVSTGILTPTVLPYELQTYLPLIHNARRTAVTSNSERADEQTAIDLSVGAHVYEWDLERTGLVGNLDQVIIRFTAYPACVNTCQYAKDVVYAPPLRVRGMAVRVMQQTDSDAVPGANAIIYRAPAGTDEFALLTNHAGEPLRTNQEGYLIGHPSIFEGDKLVALLPVDYQSELSGTLTISQTNVYTQLYHTSAPITMEGKLDAQEVQSFSNQTLTVSAKNHLLLFHLRVGLEWDARNDTVFQQQLSRDLQRTSAMLYDLTNGQAALGTVDVFHDKGFWSQVDVAVTARNNQRPSAVLGGRVLTPTLDNDIDGQPIVYLPGQVWMPPRYTKYGDTAQSADNDDWAQVLAHELGHYLFRLPDNYLGVIDEVVTIVDCPGSVMTNPFLTEYSEFLNPIQWVQEPECQRTLAERKLHRSDWEGIAAAEPLLTDQGAIPGPQSLLLPITQVRFWSPTWYSDTVGEVEFFLKNDQGQLFHMPSGTGQAYLLTKRVAPDAEDRSLNERVIEYLVDLGRPEGDDLLARGAAIGDSLCVFDASTGTLRSGCTTVDEYTRNLELTTVEGWQPDVRVTGVSTRTVNVVVSGVPTTQLQVQLYPAVGTASTPVTMTKAGDTFTATVTASQGAYYGHIRICAPTCTTESGDTSVREFIVEFANKFDWGGQSFDWGGQSFDWGGQSFDWGGQSFDWGGQSFDWGTPAIGWGAQSFAWGAPVMSSDGQVQVIPLENTFAINADYLLQRLDFVPTLPSWLTSVGHAYRFDADTPPANASILFRYLETDLPLVAESDLVIHFSPDNGHTWQRRSTEIAEEWNLASTRMLGAGIYVLTASQPMQPLQPGCNLPMGYPMRTIRPLTEALASLAGAYTSVYLGDATAPSGWRLYDATVEPPFASLVNTLTSTRLGDAYFIFATEPVTPYLPVDLARDTAVQAASVQIPDDVIVPPATYYGWITPTVDFTPTIGMPVTAEIDGIVYGTTTIIELDGKLAYVLIVNANGINRCGPSNRQVTFGVGPWVMPNSRIWDNSQAWFHPLTMLSSSYSTKSTFQSAAILPTSAETFTSTGSVPPEAAIQEQIWLPIIVKDWSN